MELLLASFAVIFSTILIYWFSILIIDLFSNQLDWFPKEGWHSEEYLLNQNPSDELIAQVWKADQASGAWYWLMKNSPEGFFRDLTDRVYHSILPWFVLTIYLFSFFILVLRSSIFFERKKNYIKTAEVKGLPKKDIVRIYICKIPNLNLIFTITLQMSFFISILMLVEIPFNWPGLGNLLYQSVIDKNLSLMQFAFIYLIILTLIISFVIDMLHKIINPRANIKH